MAILENEVLVKGWGKNLQYYRQKGYTVQQGETIKVKITDLNETSKTKVTKICDICNMSIHNQKYVDVFRSRKNNKGIDYCNKCKGISISAKQKMSLKEVDNLLSYYNLNRLDGYINANTLFDVVNKDGYFMKIRYTDLKCGHIPDIFSKYNPFTIDNIKRWIALNNKPIELISKRYETSQSNLEWKCKNVSCEDFDMPFFKNWGNVSQGQGCSTCKKREMLLTRYTPEEENSLHSVNPELCKEWDYEKNIKSPKEYYPNSDKIVWWKCNACKNSWSAKINSRSNGNGCPTCRESKGERRISYLLKINNINFHRQKKFTECKNIKALPFDFFIDRQFLIEFDGEQHFNSYEYFGGKEKFQERIKNDQTKIAYCIKNNIPLFRIPYWEFNNIEVIIENILKHYGLIEKDEIDRGFIHTYLVNHHDWSHEKYLKIGSSK